ncbi:MAG: serine hydrolase, partial [Candidatus Dormibacteria bacterium]
MLTSVARKALLVPAIPLVLAAGFAIGWLGSGTPAQSPAIAGAPPPPAPLTAATPTPTPTPQ